MCGEFKPGPDYFSEKLRKESYKRMRATKRGPMKEAWTLQPDEGGDGVSVKRIRVYENAPEAYEALQRVRAGIEKLREEYDAAIKTLRAAELSSDKLRFPQDRARLAYEAEMKGND